MNSSLEKEVSVSKRELEEVLGEKALLGEVLLYLCLSNRFISLLLSGGRTAQAGAEAGA